MSHEPTGSPPADDDTIRSQVLSLFTACDNDMGVLMERTVRALQQAGRHDLKLETGGSGTVMVVSQAKAHARGHKSFKQQLDDMELARVTGAAKSHIEHMGVEHFESPNGIQVETYDEYKARQKDARRRAKSSLARSGSPTKGETFQQHLDGTRRCFTQSEKDLKLSQFPTSKYTGNYLLYRWGGAYPQHANYGFYRRYGSSGRGAVGAEYHNYPNGERPSTEHIYS